MDLPELRVADEPGRSWLSEHGQAEASVWLVLHKKGGHATDLTYDQALDHALRFGWIDGQVARRDAESYRQRFTPRRARSAWSARNVEHFARLQSAGLMMPAGLAAVAAAKLDGRWDLAYPGQPQAEMPADLIAAIAANASAMATDQTLTSANRYALIHRVNDAKRAETLFAGLRS